VPVYASIVDGSMKKDTRTPPVLHERDIFLAALEKAPGERGAFLDGACGQNRALRARVEELLREEENVGAFLEKPAALAGVGPGGTALIAVVTEKPGDRIGRYKLLQKIGEGGCGIVYMAEQEEPVRRRVALKIIKLGMDTKSVIARFEAERQALAMMDHPNIARVLDAGATETGRPFFVMELVRGIRITEYCDQNHLPAEERLKLFVQVCQAIQHAHHKGIIHRDVKPSNILVTLHDGVAVPKVIDFGIAKATEQRLTDKTLFTEFAAFIGTPAYMSPEQAEMSGLDIDTRSDIYSLGVLLYELLTGKTPFDAETLLRAGLDECRRTIREEEPARPSTRLATMVGEELTTTAQQRRIEAVRLVHLLRGDLDWIVMKSLEKDRGRRYATANDLAQDVQRYLESEPVLARPPSNVYRLQKLIRRHRGAFAATTAIAATLVVAAGISAWQAVLATQAERRAKAAQKQEVHLREQAENERARAEQEKSAASLSEYTANINLAQQSLQDGNYGRAIQLLSKHIPDGAVASGVATLPADLRGFEWRHLWHVSRGDEHVQFPTQDFPVESVAVSPDGELVAIGGFDRCAVFSMRSRSLVRTLPKGAVSLAFLRGGKGLLTASRGTVRLWDTTSWAEQIALSNNFAPMVLSADGKRLLTTMREGMMREGVRLWDTTTWKEIRLFERAAGPMAFSPDGKRVVLDSRAGIVVRSVDGEGEVVLANSTNVFVRSGPWAAHNDQSIAFSPDGKSIVAARNVLSDRGVFILSVWDAATGEETGQIPAAQEVEHTGVIAGLGFSPDAKILATASMDHSIRLWDFQNRRVIGTLQGHVSEVWALAFSPDGRALVTGGKDGSVKLWETHRPQKEDVLTDASIPLAFSRDSRKLAALGRLPRGEGIGAVVIFNLATSEVEQKIALDVRGVRFGLSVAVSEDLGTIAQTFHDGVKLWHTDGSEASILKAADRRVDWLEMSPNGREMITGGRDARLRWWDVRAGTNLVIKSELFRMTFSPDSSTVAGFGRGNSVEIWDVATRSLRTNFVIESQAGFAQTHAFSQDGRVLAVACMDDSIRLYNTSNGRLTGTFTGHKQVVKSVAFSPDGKTLATASDDSTVKLWHTATQQELLTDRRLGGAVRDLMFSPDGQVLVAGTSMFSGTGRIRLYRAPVVADADLLTQTSR
jgi:WD40 repeat protein/serine/threonine protein kinase